MSRSVLIRAAVMVTIAVLFVAGTSAYLSASRLSGDAILADAALENLTDVGRAADITQPRLSYSNALEDYWMASDLFLHSDTRDALPDVTPHIELAWTAYLVADELWRLAEAGETQPLVSDVYAAEQLLGAADLSSVTVGEGDVLRFDNTDMRAVVALFGIGEQHRAIARESLDGLTAGIR